MKHLDPTASPRWTVKSYPPRSTMNPAIGRRFVGTDIDGKAVSGVILHVGAYDKQTGDPVTYTLQLDNNGHCGQTAVISANAVCEHLKGLALCASMESDNE